MKNRRTEECTKTGDANRRPGPARRPARAGKGTRRRRDDDCFSRRLRQEERVATAAMAASRGGDDQI